MSSARRAPPRDESESRLVFDRARLDREASGRVEDALTGGAALQAFRRSDARVAHPTSQGLTLRGLGGNAASRTLVLLDGVPQADPFGGWVSWPGYDALPIERITVTRGGGSAADGSGALAGTVSIETRSSDTPAFEGSLWGGSRRSLAGRAVLEQPLELARTTLSASYEGGAGFIPTAPELRGPVDRAAPYEQAGAALRASIPLTTSWELEASGRAFSDTRERGVPFSDNTNQGVDLSLRAISRPARGLSWSLLGYLQGRVLSSRFASVSGDRTTANPTLDQFHVPALGSGARLELRPESNATLGQRGGTEWRGTSGRTEERYAFVDGQAERERAAGGRSDTFGIFHEVNVRPTSELVFTGSLRVDFWSLTGGFRSDGAIGSAASEERFADRSGWEGSGRWGGAWQPHPSIRLRSAAFTGFRLPTLNELYRPYRVGADAIAAAPGLRPERLVGAEAGIDGLGIPGVVLSTTVFDNRLRDAIANVTLAEGPGDFPGVGFVSAAGTYRERRNLDAIRSQGIELGLTLDGDTLGLLPGFRVDVFYTHLRAFVQSHGEASALNGRAPAQTPQSSLFAGFSWRSKADELSVALDVRYVSRQFEDDREELPLAEALTLGAVAAVAVTEGLRLVGRVENLTDTPIESARTSSGLVELATPRTLWLGLRWAHFSRLTQ